MTSEANTQGSWLGFLGGCLTIIVIFGGLIGAFFHFRGQDQARLKTLESNIFEPYWAHIKKEEYEQAFQLRSSQWRSRYSVEDLAKAYRQAKKEHGDLKSTTVHVANEYYEPGQQGEACRVETYYEFQDGWKGKVLFHLTRPDENADWQLGDSSTPLSRGLGDGPY